MRAFARESRMAEVQAHSFRLGVAPAERPVYRPSSPINIKPQRGGLAPSPSKTAKPLCFSPKLLFFHVQLKRNSLPAGVLHEILTSRF